MSLRQNEGGFTLIEAGVSMLIMAIVLGLFAPTLLVLVHGESNVGALTDANVNMQPALELLQNQVNAASVIYDPVNTTSSYYHATLPKSYKHDTIFHYTTVSAGFALLLYTVSGNGQTVEKVCSQWRISPATTHTTFGAPSNLTTKTTNAPAVWDRVWNPTTHPASLPFRKEAQGVAIVNTINLRARTQQKPFTLAGQTPPQNQQALITLWISPSKKAAKIQYKTIDVLQGVPLPRQTRTKCAVPPSL
jgi:type II secretory pathway pseudopilin PulG